MLIEISATILDDIFAEKHAFADVMFSNPTETNVYGKQIAYGLIEASQELGLGFADRRDNRKHVYFDKIIKSCRVIGIKTPTATLHKVFNKSCDNRLQYHVNRDLICVGLPLIRNVNNATYDGVHLLSTPNVATDSKLFTPKKSLEYLTNQSKSYEMVTAVEEMNTIWWEAFEIFVKGKKTSVADKSYYANMVIKNFSFYGNHPFKPKFLEKKELLRIVENSRLPPKRILVEDQSIRFSFVWFVKLELAKLATKPGVQFITQF